MTNTLDQIPEACEFCGEGMAMLVLSCHPRSSFSTVRRGEVYVACPNCLFCLINLSLAPWQFNRARDAGGDVNRFYLHADFYYLGTGEALQPRLVGLTRRKEPT